MFRIPLAVLFTVSFAWAYKFLSRALNLVRDALELARGIAGPTTNALLDLAADVLGRAGHSMFIHRILFCSLCCMPVSTWRSSREDVFQIS